MPTGGWTWFYTVLCPKNEPTKQKFSFKFLNLFWLVLQLSYFTSYIVIYWQVEMTGVYQIFIKKILLPSFTINNIFSILETAGNGQNVKDLYQRRAPHMLQQ